MEFQFQFYFEFEFQFLKSWMRICPPCAASKPHVMPPYVAQLQRGRKRTRPSPCQTRPMQPLRTGGIQSCIWLQTILDLGFQTISADKGKFFGCRVLSDSGLLDEKYERPHGVYIEKSSDATPIIVHFGLLTQKLQPNAKYLWKGRRDRHWQALPLHEYSS